ncbi:GH36-type glycosyl hydrolase domain-containing protein [Clostridium sp. CF012]|uniref:GH36-type glycosyl hydrolase domain-containing protein n=1 Tax=Clostridium sp. CF012 TaxID=2843319 RepID=UPI001C0D73A8|nr:cellobiose phosphorylase [Clostridium sp. CF012]MBU3144250.1 cellobiose phosphorylase [Clostridium sp. CF012]
MWNSNRSDFQFTSEEGEFKLVKADNTSYLYFPLTNEGGMMSSITPLLQGDIKTNQNTFLMTPVSSEDLHNSRSGRNFWIFIERYGPWSLMGSSPNQISKHFQDESEETVIVEAGFLWHRVIRENSKIGIKAEITSFVPQGLDKVELMKVTITNTGDKTVEFTPTVAMPIFGRSADNIRDHRHVTSLLQRTYTSDYGVTVRPTLSFDERGHKLNNVVYSVQGVEDYGDAPIGFFPEIEGYIGEGGNLEWPEAIVRNSENYYKANEILEGYEAIGGLRFKNIILQKGHSKTYIMSMSISEDEVEALNYRKKYCNLSAFDLASHENKKHWQDKINKLCFKSGDDIFDIWMKWVALQPILRRIYGCSFLPHHDYGRGGRGWRDLWQDCLALLIMEPEGVRSVLLNNYAGVRIDGSNATIIGAGPGEFIADRNNIARIWMDHGAWPFLTTKLYIDQSGDLEFLLQDQVYFKDKQIKRCTDIDENWNDEYGNKLKNIKGDIYKGTILEHILIENLTPFFNVGIHNNIKLEGADWNDGLDMASDKGESVAFTAFYGSNLMEISNVLESLKNKALVYYIEIASEMVELFDSLGEKIDYEVVPQKLEVLNKYYNKCTNNISGDKTNLHIDNVIRDLRRKGNWIINHVRKNEWIKNIEGYAWFNGYYDNEGDRVEGDNELGVRMILTGQVFTIMGNVATDEQIDKIIEASNRYLRDEAVGGYRLNTNFNEVKLNMGRLFGFAYGHKENGAMFSHMAIMYGNALYKRGYVKSGFEVIKSIYKHCVDFDKSRIYPGVPEYINQKGRGMYNYLTGSASWLLLTMLNEVYGVKGSMGDLVIQPKILKEQFNKAGEVEVLTTFAGITLNICYKNINNVEFGEYKISRVKINDEKVQCVIEEGKAIINRALIKALPSDKTHKLTVELL